MNKLNLKVLVLNGFMFKKGNRTAKGLYVIRDDSYETINMGNIEHL